MGGKKEREEITDLEQLLDLLDEADDADGRVTLDAVLDKVGRRSFGPLLLLAGLITMMPVIGDIPGVPGILGILVIIVAAQMLVRRDHLWLPGWLLRRSVERETLRKGLGWLRRPAHFIDSLLRPRLCIITGNTGVRVLALVCMLIGAVMPFMEVVPFSANGAGAALVAFGLAVVARDGLIALIAFTVTLGTFGVVGYFLLF